MGEINDDDLDAILDGALDDFNEPAKPAASSLPPPPSSSSSSSTSTSTQNGPASFPQMNDIFADLNNPAFRSEFEQFMKELDPSFNQNLDSLVSNPEFLSELTNVQNLLGTLGLSGDPSSAPSSSSSSAPPSSSAPSSSAPSSSASSSAQPKSEKAQTAPKKENLQSKITETLNQLKNSDEEAQSEVGSGEDPLAGLLNMMNGGGSPEMMEGFLEEMVGQLMSKEILYEPMKELATLYPVWLEESKSTLSEAEYKRCQSQYEVTIKIVEVYEKSGADSKLSLVKVLELMQQMQEYGQPPASLLQRMAPGLEIGPDGLPKIPGLGGDQCPVM